MASVIDIASGLDVTMGRCGVVVCGQVVPLDRAAPWVVTGKDLLPVPSDRYLAAGSPELRVRLRERWIERLQALQAWSCCFGDHTQDLHPFGLVVVGKLPGDHEFWAGWVLDAGYETMGVCPTAPAQRGLILVSVAQVTVPDEVSWCWDPVLIGARWL